MMCNFVVFDWIVYVWIRGKWEKAPLNCMFAKNTSFFTLSQLYTLLKRTTHWFFPGSPFPPNETIFKMLVFISRTFFPHFSRFLFLHSILCSNLHLPLIVSKLSVFSHILCRWKIQWFIRLLSISPCLEARLNKWTHSHQVKNELTEKNDTHCLSIFSWQRYCCICCSTFSRQSGIFWLCWTHSTFTWMEIGDITRNRNQINAQFFIIDIDKCTIINSYKAYFHDYSERTGYSNGSYRMLWFVMKYTSNTS